MRVVLYAGLCHIYSECGNNAEYHVFFLLEKELYLQIIWKVVKICGMKLNSEFHKEQETSTIENIVVDCKKG